VTEKETNKKTPTVLFDDEKQFVTGDPASAVVRPKAQKTVFSKTQRPVVETFAFVSGFRPT